MLRAIAASAVIVDHALDALATRHVVGPDVQQLGYFFGWLGVATFLAISGLIMIRTSESRFGQPGAAASFALQRLIRIVPLYWIATLVYVVLKSARGSSYDAAEILRSLAFIPYAHPGSLVMRPIVGQGWTLNLEMFFYAIFALCLLLPKGLGKAALLISLPLLVILGLAVRPLFPYADPLTALQFWTDPIILFFAFGVILGLFELNALSWRRWTRPLVLTFSLLAAACGAFLAAGLHFPLQFGWQMLLGLFCVGAVLICTTPHDQGISAPEKVLIDAGDASYSTYLFHPLCIIALGALYDRLPAGSLHPVLFVALAVVSGNGLGALIYRRLERPLTRLLRRLEFHRPQGKRRPGEGTASPGHR
jgi:peptidoglycan/LPS O-acetylase OafA/YrhL